MNPSVRAKRRIPWLYRFMCRHHPPKKTEAALRESDTRLRLATSSARLGPSIVPPFPCRDPTRHVSSAVARSLGGTVSPNVLAVRAMMTALAAEWEGRIASRP
jgi:hypothetical protein